MVWRALGCAGLSNVVGARARREGMATACEASRKLSRGFWLWTARSGGAASLRRASRPHASRWGGLGYTTWLPRTSGSGTCGMQTCSCGGRREPGGGAAVQLWGGGRPRSHGLDRHPGPLRWMRWHAWWPRARRESAKAYSGLKLLFQIPLPDKATLNREHGAHCRGA